MVLEVGAFEKQGYTGREVMEFFSGLGYEGFVLSEGGRLVAVDENLDHPEAVSVNRILLPDERKKLLGDLFV